MLPPELGHAVHQRLDHGNRVGLVLQAGDRREAGYGLGEAIDRGSDAGRGQAELFHRRRSEGVGDLLADTDHRLLQRLHFARQFFAVVAPLRLADVGEGLADALQRGRLLRRHEVPCRGRKPIKSTARYAH